MTELKISIGPQIGSLANWYGVKISEEVQRNVTLLHRSKTTIRQPQVKTTTRPKKCRMFVETAPLSFTGHAKDSLWSLDLFRCESAMLRTYWVLVVMDQFTRRIVGFAVQRGVVDGMALCLMFNRAIHTQALPKYLSSDHDPLYRFHQWGANLRVLDVKQIKTVPYVPLSHPFVERLIGSFVVHNKSPILWRSPLCGVRALQAMPAGALSERTPHN